MATLGSTYFDLIDYYSREDNGQIAAIIEMLMENNGMLDDAVTQTCNNGTKHKHTIRTGLPSVSWGKLYQGIPQSKSTTAQVEDVTGWANSRSEVDVELLKLSGNEAAVRLSEATSHIESMNQTIASTLIYGDQSTDPEKFTGFAPRFNDLSAANGNQIIDAGGTGSDNTSVWIVGWGDDACHLLHPKNTMAGLDREDKGEQQVLDGNGDPYFAKVELFKWHVGLAVKDWRKVVRIANIDASDLAAGSVDIYKWMRKAKYQLPPNFRGQQSLSNASNTANTRYAIYCNKDVLEALEAAGTNSGTTDNFVRLKPMEIEGKTVNTYQGIPIRQTDAILNTEARVV